MSVYWSDGMRYEKGESRWTPNGKPIRVSPMLSKKLHSCRVHLIRCMNMLQATPFALPTFETNVGLTTVFAQLRQ